MRIDIIYILRTIYTLPGKIKQSAVHYTLFITHEVMA